ncbi:hypothetical protein BH10PAT1_BH10PAT1_3460 [soil metagenome]
MNQIWLAFITGLTTGGLSCMAVQGGLLASSLSSQTEEEITRNQRFAHVGLFLIAKIIAYTILGGLLGLIGSKLIISPVFQGSIQIVIGLFMLGTAARLLNLHPIFRYFVIQPPKFVYKFMKNESKSKSIFTPLLLGAMTILIPCGITQAMMILAVGTGSAVLGAAILLAFTLGTTPVFFTLGVTASHLMKKKAFIYISCFVIIILGILSINTGQILRGSNQTLQNYAIALKSMFGNQPQIAGVATKIDADGKQQITINVTSGGYQALSNTLKVGVPTKLIMVSNNVQSCARSFLIPSLGISKILPQDGNTEIDFTPTKAGSLAYTCGMGMYTGSFNVL